MIRTFHSIGQGAFYTEEFNNFTIVYDCGSDNNVPLIESEIRNTFDYNQNIDALFISHLHADHVNGVEFLMDYCNVKRVFLPLLNDMDRIGIYIHNYLNNITISPFIQSLINLNDNNQDDFGDTQIIFVPDLDPDFEPELGGDPIDFNKISSGILPQNAKIGLPTTTNWVFIPFNFRNQSRSIELQDKLHLDHLNFNSFSEFREIWRDLEKRNQIKNVYESIPGSLNANSMTLYSGPELNINDMYFRLRFPFYFRHPVRFLAGNIYFGDYESKGDQKWRQFINCYQAYWNMVGTVQIPHHGSHHNYNIEINHLNPKISVISAGNSNRHRHPHASTVRDILRDGGVPILVTENTGSRLMCEIIGI